VISFFCWSVATWPRTSWSCAAEALTPCGALLPSSLANDRLTGLPSIATSFPSVAKCTIEESKDTPGAVQLHGCHVYFGIDAQGLHPPHPSEVLRGDGSVFRFKGSVALGGVRFEGDATCPLVFVALAGPGLV
jgi:hypothetical protein